MQIKRFEAKTMTAALKMVKDEFGPEAVILSARSLRRGVGIFTPGRGGVEVTAAKDSGWTPAGTAVRWSGEVPEAAEENPAPGPPRRRPGLFQSLNQNLRSLGGRRRPPPAGPGADPDLLPDAPLAEFYHHLLSQELQRELAADIIAAVKDLRAEEFPQGPDPLKGPFTDLLEARGLQEAAEPESSGRPRVIVLVGPAGAGKTTVALKLAMRQKARHGPGCALLTLDDYRIGALEQLRIYTGILDLPLRVAGSPAEARKAVEDLQSAHTIIVDTPGISPGQDERRREQNRVLDALKQREVHLVLNACGREKDLQRAVDDWTRRPVDAFAFSHLDEAGACGHLVNLLLRAGKPVSFVGTGASIPDDLAARPLAYLIDRLWLVGHSLGLRRPAAKDREAAPGPRSEAGRFLANRNSDLYHRADCRWARRIKREHAIEFATAEEAEFKQYHPCRDCAPDRVDAPQDPAHARGGMRISTYR